MGQFATAARGMGTTQVRRRRREAADSTQRTSVTLHRGVVARAKAAVQEGAAPNLSAFVEEAVQEKLLRSRRAALYESYRAAAADPDFMAAMESTARAFDPAVADGLLGEQRGE